MRLDNNPNALTPRTSPEGRPPYASRTAAQKQGTKAKPAKAGKPNRRTSAAAPRGSLYEEVTAKIIAQLEDGIFPWVQPWSAANAVPGLPRNAVTGRAYSGVNVLILWGAVIERSFSSQDWLTFKQALAAGGCVRKGEKGQTICFANRFTPDAEKKRANSEGGGNDAAQSIPFLKRFTVFNAAQCDGLVPSVLASIAADPVPLPERQLIADAEHLISASAVRARSMTPRKIMCRYRRNWPLPPRSIITEQPCTNSATGPATLRAWRGHSAAALATRLMRVKNCAPNWPRRSYVLRLVSCQRCAMPIISARGFKSCARIVAPFSKPPAKPARQRIFCWRSRPTALHQTERCLSRQRHDKQINQPATA